MKKHKGCIFILAGVLLLLMSFDIFASWLNIEFFFAVMLLTIGLHVQFCKDCCKLPTKK
ncbi:hypothetical protein GOV04_02850 [Candidatus Woesearchaeota archaeon]|nr:hypothetical protein [Candidatus Woesearchaeota archaeon]